jgi:hypothetical protein
MSCHLMRLSLQEINGNNPQGKIARKTKYPRIEVQCPHIPFVNPVEILQKANSFSLDN